MGDILKDRVAVVTGSGQGIGRAIALALAREGAKIVTNSLEPATTNYAILTDVELNALSGDQRAEVARLSEEYSGEAEDTARRIRDDGGEAVAFFGDVSRFDTAAGLIRRAVDSFGKVDVLVNVAGAFGFSPIWEMTEEKWDKMLGVKLKSYFNCIRHAVPYMMEQKWGRIINCTSKAWAGDALRYPHYAAANAGVVGLTRNVANELWEYGVTCNAFVPWARTRASFELSAFHEAGGKSWSPFVEGRNFPYEITPLPEAIGPFIAYLASGEAEGVSGSIFFSAGPTVAIYANPDLEKSVTKFDGIWTVDELRQQLPRTVLAGYQPWVRK